MIVTGFLCNLSNLSTIHAETPPVCQSISSDSDGDGYGWENRNTCVVTEATGSEPRSEACVDDDNDGWGWDGTRVCRVDVMCYDVAPIGDGWGWDGANSCEIAAYDAQFSELGMLKSQGRLVILFGSEIPAATAVCANTVYRLYSNGRVETFRNGGKASAGQWSTGFEDSDGIIHLGNSVSGRWLLLTRNSVTLHLYSQQDVECFWE